MGLPRAIKAHALNNYQEAEVHYRRAYEQGKANEILYQNFGALLKKIGKREEAISIFEEGIRLFQGHAGIKRNYANLLRSEYPSYAVELYIEAIHCSLTSSKGLDIINACCDDLIGLLREKDLLYWSRSLIATALSMFEPTPSLLKDLLIISDRLNLSLESKEAVIAAIDLSLKSAPLKDAVSLDFALATHYLSDTQHKRSLTYFESALQRIRNAPRLQDADHSAVQELVDTNSWNFACALLSLREFNRGWSLFEHGLRTPADGHQKWQRALVKPFSSDQIPLWRGEKNPNKRLLILDEQGIGDCMMFASLIPALLPEVQNIGFFLTPRLETIYRRSFESEIKRHQVDIYTINDLQNNKLMPNFFDYQIPLGSICQHRFTSIESYGPRIPILISDEALAKKLRNDYLAGDQSPKLLVGISWRGGGRGTRIKQKSIDAEIFGELMLKHPHVRFLDVQYGNTSDQVSLWKDMGIDVIHDPRIDPLKDMDQWLSQVKACDAVLSVANTTIHGAGGLNIPTLCLLSVHSDWRWLVDSNIKRSYWYPSVGIARESKSSDDSWATALHDVHDWLQNGCPMPIGSAY